MSSYISCQEPKSSIHVSFDTLFPETADKQLYDTMLQLWSDVTLLHDERMKDRQKQDTADIIAGQLVRIRYLIEHMHTKKNTLSCKEVLYLQSIATQLSGSFGAFFTQEHIEPLWSTINDGFELLSGICAN